MRATHQWLRRGIVAAALATAVVAQGMAAGASSTTSTTTHSQASNTPAATHSQSSSHSSSQGAGSADAVTPSSQLRTEPPMVSTGTGTDANCLSGDTASTQGCVVSQLQPEITAPSACAGMSGAFKFQVGSVNPSDLSTYSISYTSSGSTVVPSTEFTDGASGQTYTWAFEPDPSNTSCFDTSDPVWRTFRIDMVRSGIQSTDSIGPFSVGLSSGSLTTNINTTSVNLASGSESIGLQYSSPGGVGYAPSDPTGTLPTGWTLTGVGSVPPWVTITQVGTGNVPAAVVLTSLSGSQMEYTNTLAGTSATGGAWAPPVQAGLATGDFGTLTDSGDLTSAGSTFTWSSGQQVVQFTKAATGTWVVSSSDVVESGGDKAPSIEPTWSTEGTTARLSGLKDPVSGKTATFYYGNGTSCNGQEAPVDGSNVYYAPSGMLCGWTTFDGTTTYVWYSLVGTSSYEIGWVSGAGDSNTLLSWSSDGSSTPELTELETPDGYDAQQSATADLSESDTSWWINYDAFGNVSSIVSPLPGVSTFVASADANRVGHVYSFNTSSSGVQWATISQAIIADNNPSSVSAGASIVEELEYDDAWRPLLAANQTASGATEVTSYTWDTVHDRMLATTYPNGREVVTDYDYLGRAIGSWGPAPSSDFTENSAGTAVAPNSGYGTSNLINGQNTYDADSANKLTGFAVETYASSTVGGTPASSFGSCQDGQCSGSNPALLDWTSLPSEANVSGGSWSMALTATREAPVAGANDQLEYKVATDSNGEATLWADGVCTTSPTSSSCATSNTATVPSSVAAGDPVTLSVQYSRQNNASVSASVAVTVTVSESTNGGSSWTPLTATELDPGFGLTTSTSQTAIYSSGGSATSMASAASYTNPVLQEVGSTSVTAGSLSATTQQSYASYNGSSEWGQPTGLTNPGGNQDGATYWTPGQTSTDPCDSSSSAVNQGGLQETYAAPSATSTSASGTTTTVTYDSAGRPLNFSYKSADGSTTESVCRSYDSRGQLTDMHSGDSTLAETWAYPWDNSTSTDPFEVTNTFTVPSSSGGTTSYTATAIVDLLGRTVQSTDVWGTTTTTDYALDASTGVTTTTTTTTTKSGYTQTQVTTTNSDGTTHSMTRTDSSGTYTVLYTYNDDESPHTAELEGPSGTEIVTETFGYDATTGQPISGTYSKGGTTEASDTVTLSPDALRELGDTIVAQGTTYTWAYNFSSLGFLTGATLASSNNSISGSWAYAFSKDTSAQTGENPNAYLNGDITSKSVTLDGTSSTATYHYGYDDRLTRTSDSSIGDPTYNSLGDMTKVGADSISYDSLNYPTTVSDSTNSESVTRLIDGSVIAQSTTTSSGSGSVEYSANGLILNSSGTPETQIENFGPVTATFAIASGTTTQLQVNAMNGNRLETLNSAGSVTSTSPYLYDPYGAQIEPSAATSPSTSGPTYGWEAVSGANTSVVSLPVVLMGARIYLPSAGLFTSPDPKPGGNLTAYNYSNSDPIDYNDPTGETSSFVAFFTKDIPKGWNWAFGQNSTWYTGLAGFAVLLVVVILIILIIVLVVYLTVDTGGADTLCLDGTGDEFGSVGDDFVQENGFGGNNENVSPEFQNYQQQVWTQTQQAVNDLNGSVLDENTGEQFFNQQGRAAGQSWINAGRPAAEGLADDPYSTIYNGARINFMAQGMPAATPIVGFNAGFGTVTGLTGLVAA